MDTTILVPARIRNAQEAEWLKTAIASAEGQGKIIIAYNNCTYEPLPKFAKKATIHTIEAVNLAAVRNFLVKLVKTPYFFFLDADDLLPKETIAKMEAFIKTVPVNRYVYGGTIIFGEGKLEVPARDFDCKALTQGVYFPNGVLQPTQNLEIVGGWDENLPILEDKEWWIKAAEHDVIGEPLKNLFTYEYRQNADSLVATYRKTPAWQEALAYIELHHKKFFQGEYPMCCGKPKTPISTFSSATPIVAKDGQITIHYMLGTGDATYWGAVTGQRYIVSASHPDLVIDVQDALTNDRKKPGLLELTRNNHPVFLKVP
jgi:hypothetical protein